MLAVVTFMAVVFLAVSRRERASVTASSDLTDARLMADAALARAQSEIVSQVLTATNRGAFDLLVSTNFYSLAGYTAQANAAPNVTNVSYWRSLNANFNARKPDLTKQERMQVIGNLQFDPRPPVFIRTNYALPESSPFAWDFRHFVDLNRNGQFENTGAASGGVFSGLTPTFFSGDPQWIGILEHPDQPHSEVNRFVGRYAFIVLPSGKSLDLNHIHNNAKVTSLAPNGYFRNQGVGSWEINLAAFLRELNPAVWGGYFLQTNASPNSGKAFDDALAILRHRYDQGVNDWLNAPVLGASSAAVFGTSILQPGVPAANYFANFGIDLYGSANAVPPNPATDPSRFWAGGESFFSFYDLQELFVPGHILFQPQNSFTNLPALGDPYAYYRLLAQMGVDSAPALTNELYFFVKDLDSSNQGTIELRPTNKFHLNFKPTLMANRQANGVPWDPERDWSPAPLNAPAGDERWTNPTNFFYQVADRLIRANLTTNVTIWNGTLVTNFMLGETPVRNDISITNIQVYHPGLIAGQALPGFWTTNVEYTAALHRLLQLAANVYDATTTRLMLAGGNRMNNYPTVFRPLFHTMPEGDVRIVGFAEVMNPTPTFFPWRNLNNPADRLALMTRTNDNVNGVPWVIGAKRRDLAATDRASGFPNFNEFSLETVVTITRKLELARNLANRSLITTNQMHTLSISNILGVEAWNSFSDLYPGRLRLVVSNDFNYALSNVVNGATNLVRYQPNVIANNMQVMDWPGRGSAESFVLPVQTNFFIITNAAYVPSLVAERGDYFASPYERTSFEASLDPPVLRLYLTNNLRYWLIDESVTPNRVIDFVNMEGLNSVIDISQVLLGDTTSGGGGYFPGNSPSGNQTPTLGVNDFWRTNKVGGIGPTSPTQGILNQIAVSSGAIDVGDDIWTSSSVSLSRSQRQREIARFQRFILGDTNLTMQVPYTPTKKIYQRLAWQANDPLVHYTKADLSDPILTNPNSANNYDIVRPPTSPLPSRSNLRAINERYRPWGGNPNRSASGADAYVAYSMAYKDPLVRSSDDWNFPTNKFPNIGWLGRVHRGTPWQTVYLKSHIDVVTGEPVSLQNWAAWSGSFATHPTNDWKLLELFTTAPTASAARGLLSVNQTNVAAWSAVLSGLQVLSNSVPNPGPTLGTGFSLQSIEPATPQVQAIVAGINRVRTNWSNGLFPHMGDVLAAPELSVASPFLNLSSLSQIQNGLSEEAVEFIPRRVLSLLKGDDPRFVVYAFGQSLKPAARSLATSGNFYNICTNYQITGEVVTKAVLRIDNAPKQPRVVVESYNVLPPY